MIFVLVWCCVSTRFATFIIILQNGPVRSSTLIIFVENLSCLVLAVEYILSLNIYNDNCIFTVDSIPFSLKEIFGTKINFSTTQNSAKLRQA